MRSSVPKCSTRFMQINQVRLVGTVSYTFSIPILMKFYNVVLTSMCVTCFFQYNCCPEVLQSVKCKCRVQRRCWSYWQGPSQRSQVPTSKNQAGLDTRAMPKSVRRWAQHRQMNAKENLVDDVTFLNKETIVCFAQFCPLELSSEPWESKLLCPALAPGCSLLAVPAWFPQCILQHLKIHPTCDSHFNLIQVTMFISQDAQLNSNSACSGVVSFPYGDWYNLNNVGSTEEKAENNFSDTGRASYNFSH